MNVAATTLTTTFPDRHTFQINTINFYTCFLCLVFAKKYSQFKHHMMLLGRTILVPIMATLSE